MPHIENYDERLEQIIIAVENKENIILHGSGGTGKSFSLRKIATHLFNSGKTVCCTATTGVAALNLNVPEAFISATTLHSWAGVGLADATSKKLLAKVQRDDKAFVRWLSTDYLIIDEVSMFGADFFDKLDFIGRHVRQNEEKPFGGLKLILSGDFLQLPPVKDKWVFKSDAWEELDLVPFIFEEPKRYDDLDYFDLLLRVRMGEPSDEDLKKLRARVKSYRKMNKILSETDSAKVIKPTILYSRKVDVEYHNDQELDELPGKLFEFVAVDNFKAYNNKARYDYYIKKLDDIIPRILSYKVGAQVMLKVNRDVKKGLVNGSRGVITDIVQADDGSYQIVVKFINGRVITFGQNIWEIEDKDAFSSRAQFPLILAWACTIHRGQGATLDYAVCDLGTSVFEYGQAYVALSRLRNLRGLFISEFYPSSIKVNKTAKKYVQKLKEMAEEYEANVVGESSDSDSDEDFDLVISE